MRLTLRGALLTLATVCSACATPTHIPPPAATPSLPSTGAPIVLDRVRVGFNPIGVAVTPDGAYAFVANSRDNTVSKVDVRTRRVVSTLQLNAGPAWIALAPTRDLVCVTSRDPQALVLLSLSGNYLVNTLDLPYTPEHVLVDPTETTAYLTTPNAPFLLVVDLAKRRMVRTVALTDPSLDLALTPDGRTLFVTTRSKNYNLIALSTADHNVIARASAGSGAGSIAMDPAGQYAYVVNQVSRDLTVVHVPTYHPVLTVSLDVNPLDLKLTPGGRYAYITAAQNAVLVLDTATRQIVQRVALEVSPWGLDVSPDGAMVYAANYQARVPPGTFASDTVDLSLGLNTADRVNNNTLLFIATGAFK